jgi:hypothetical protein
MRRSFSFRELLVYRINPLGDVIERLVEEVAANHAGRDQLNCPIATDPLDTHRFFLTLLNASFASLFSLFASSASLSVAFIFCSTSASL